MYKTTKVYTSEDGTQTPITKKKHKWNIFTSLTEQINGMGYSYSLFSFFKSFIVFAFFIFVFAYFHHLRWLYIILLIVSFFILLPFSIYSQYKYLYEQKRFNELCIYMKQMIINFKSSKKILASLEQTLETFEEKDRIYPLIEQAIDKIKKGESYREALNIIEKDYTNSYCMKMHAFMILTETEGNDEIIHALDNIDYETWRTDTYIYQTQKFKYQHHNSYYVIGSMIATLFVVLLFEYILYETNGVLINIFDTEAFQIDTFIYMLTTLVSYIIIKTMITGKWLREDE